MDKKEIVCSEDEDEDSEEEGEEIEVSTNTAPGKMFMYSNGVYNYGGKKKLLSGK
jgi:hypothetical protein